MTERILDFSEEAVFLHVRYEQLVIEQEGKEKTTIPLEEIAALCVSHAQVSYTNAVLSGLATKGGALVVCNEKHLPVGMMLPLVGHSTQVERFAEQASASAPTCKRLWQQLVQAKLMAQGKVLQELKGQDQGLIAMATRVKSGDSENLEAQASRRYWAALFGDSFRRDREAEDQNRHLNYGYAILRAIVARSICASGLHPSIGVHHHNRYDSFCLADDLMEPFRPLVDKAVAKWIESHDPKAPFERETKAAILSALTGRFDLEGESRTLFDVTSRLASSLAQVFSGEGQSLLIPEL
jgi:CRISPR-associated protein Cas1